MFLPVRLLLLLTLAVTAHAKPLLVYTYDSLAGKKDFGGILKKLYEEKYPGRKLEIASFPSAGEAINQLLIEEKSPRADVILGVDNSFLSRLVDKNLLAEAPAELWKDLVPALAGEGRPMVVPFNYGFPAFVYDERRFKLESNRISLKSLPLMKKTFVIEDPRLSSVGSCFLAFTRSALPGELGLTFWKGFSAKVSRVAPSWTSAYGLFLEKGADLVLSYTTSPAYHAHHEKVDTFRAILFDEGQPLQWEGVAVSKKSQRASEAWDFVRLALGNEAQEQIPLRNWMYPSVKGTTLPAVFNTLPRPIKTLPSHFGSEKERAKALGEWATVFAGTTRQ